MRRAAVVLCSAAVLLGGCGGPDSTAAPDPDGAGSGFRSGPCNRVSDDEVNAAGSGMHSKAVANDVGCFWQENTVIGTFGIGMGISTWWQRGSALDAERMLETRSGRVSRELTMNGNKGFEASDANACSVYVARGADVIGWSIRTHNPASLPDLCSIVRELAQLTQDRVN